jgi:hypothetical protein
MEAIKWQRTGTPPPKEPLATGAMFVSACVGLKIEGCGPLIVAEWVNEMCVRCVSVHAGYRHPPHFTLSIPITLSWMRNQENGIYHPRNELHIISLRKGEGNMDETTPFSEDCT